MMKEIRADQLELCPYERIAHDWMLVTAGSLEQGYNTMTASWGQLGSLWGKGGGLPTAVIYIRPQRYTKQFVDACDYFSLSFYPKDCHEALAYLGCHSGRDENKVAAVGFHPCGDEHTVWFEEADLVLICRKLYQAPIVESGFTDPSLVESCYPQKDFHEMYVGEIVKILKREAE